MYGSVSLLSVSTLSYQLALVCNDNTIKESQNIEILKSRERSRIKENKRENINTSSVPGRFTSTSLRLHTPHRSNFWHAKIIFFFFEIVVISSPNSLSTSVERIGIERKNLERIKKMMIKFCTLHLQYSCVITMLTN